MVTRRPRRLGVRVQAGFTLIELAISLSVVGAVSALALQLYKPLLQQERQDVTRDRLAAIDTALVAFVLRNGRLPCPADPTAATGVERATAGTPTCATDADATGVVPWASLGLHEEVARDAWTRPFTYRVSARLADPAVAAAAFGAVDIANPAAPLDCNGTDEQKGNMYSQVVGDLSAYLKTSPAGSPETEYAVIVISHGENGGGARLFGGGQVTPPAQLSSEAEWLNSTTSTTKVIEPIATGFAGTSNWDDVAFGQRAIVLLTRSGCST